MALYEFLFGFALASVGGAVAYYRLKKRYSTLIAKIEAVVWLNQPSTSNSPYK